MRPGLLLAAALCGVLGLSVARAQVPSLIEEQNDISSRIEQRVSLLSDKLDLNESQQANIDECLKAAVEKFKEIRDDATLTDDQRKSLWASSRKAYRNYIRDLLTDDQKAAFDALMAALAAEKAKAKAPSDTGTPLPDDVDRKDPLLDDLGAVASPVPVPAPAS